jgi:hypothetical protein
MIFGPYFGLKTDRRESSTKPTVGHQPERGRKGCAIHSNVQPAVWSSILVLLRGRTADGRDELSAHFDDSGVFCLSANHESGNVVQDRSQPTVGHQPERGRKGCAIHSNVQPAVWSSILVADGRDELSAHFDDSGVFCLSANHESGNVVQEDNPERGRKGCAIHSNVQPAVWSSILVLLRGG